MFLWTLGVMEVAEPGKDTSVAEIAQQLRFLEGDIDGWRHILDARALR